MNAAPTVGDALLLSFDSKRWGIMGNTVVCVGTTMSFVLNSLIMFNIIKQFNCIGAVLPVLLLCGLSLRRPGQMGCFWHVIPRQSTPKLFTAKPLLTRLMHQWLFVVGGRHWIDGS